MNKHPFLGKIPEKTVYGEPLDITQFTRFKNNEFYCCLNLTETEHYIIEEELSRLCKENCLTLHYYRKLKDGHVPMYREFKISGFGMNMSKLDEYIERNNLKEHMETNPHRIKNES